MLIREFTAARLRNDLAEFRRDRLLLLKLAMCVYDARTAAMMDARIWEYDTAIGTIEEELRRRKRNGR